jgi:hypothetical protein
MQINFFKKKSKLCRYRPVRYAYMDYLEKTIITDWFETEWRVPYRGIFIDGKLFTILKTNR